MRMLERQERQNAAVGDVIQRQFAVNHAMGSCLVSSLVPSKDLVVGLDKLSSCTLSHVVLCVEVAPDVVLASERCAAAEPAREALRFLLCLGHVRFHVALVVGGLEVGVGAEVTLLFLSLVVPAHVTSGRMLVRMIRIGSCGWFVLELPLILTRTATLKTSELDRRLGVRVSMKMRANADQDLWR